MGVSAAVRRLLPRRKPAPVEPFLGTRVVKVGDATYTMRSDADDLYLKGITGEFEPDLGRVFKAVVKPGGVAIDVGANLGFTAVILAQLARRVIAYEISPMTLPYLEQNVAASGHGNIEIVPVGLGAVPGEVELTMHPMYRAATFIGDHQTADRRYHESELGQVRTLDSEVARLGLDAVDFIKIDVEGFEKFVIEGGARSIATHRPVAVMEMNHWCLNAYQRIALPDFLDFVLAVFPLAYAFQADTYLDMTDPDQRYDAMHRNIVDNSFMNLLVAFEPEQLTEFYRSFSALVR
jgi:FkbM family methyltransferase